MIERVILEVELILFVFQYVIFIDRDIYYRLLFLSSFFSFQFNDARRAINIIVIILNGRLFLTTVATFAVTCRELCSYRPHWFLSPHFILSSSLQILWFYSTQLLLCNSCNVSQNVRKLFRTIGRKISIISAGRGRNYPKINEMIRFVYDSKIPFFVPDFFQTPVTRCWPVFQRPWMRYWVLAPRGSK